MSAQDTARFNAARQRAIDLKLETVSMRDVIETLVVDVAMIKEEEQRLRLTLVYDDATREYRCTKESLDAYVKRARDARDARRRELLDKYDNKNARALSTTRVERIKTEAINDVQRMFANNIVHMHDISDDMKLQMLLALKIDENQARALLDEHNASNTSDATSDATSKKTSKKTSK
jgi:hypothetical protein